MRSAVQVVPLARHRVAEDDGRALAVERPLGIAVVGERLARRRRSPTSARRPSRRRRAAGRRASTPSGPSGTRAPSRRSSSRSCRAPWGRGRSRGRVPALRRDLADAVAPRLTLSQKVGASGASGKHRADADDGDGRAHGRQLLRSTATRAGCRPSVERVRHAVHVGEQAGLGAVDRRRRPSAASRARDLVRGRVAPTTQRRPSSATRARGPAREDAAQRRQRVGTEAAVGLGVQLALGGAGGAARQAAGTLGERRSARRGAGARAGGASGARGAPARAARRARGAPAPPCARPTVGMSLVRPPRAAAASSW